MPTTEENMSFDWRPYAWHALVCILLAGLFVAGVSLAESRPFTADRYIDFLATAVLAGGAGLPLTLGCILFTALRAPIEPDEALEPEARSRRRQYRVVYWFGVVMLSLGAALLLLFAVSIGTGHGEWVSWFPSTGRSRYRFLF
jgi:hypothetical protein